MDNSLQDYRSRIPLAKDIIVGIIGLGPSGLELAKKMSQRYRVYAFDHTLQALQSPARNIRWTAYPNDLMLATHIIIADPYSRRYTRNDYEGRMSDLLWAVSIVRAAVHRRRDVTIIMASVVPAQGTTKMLLREFHTQGHRVCIAPQLPLIRGTDDDDHAENPLPKIVAGMDRESLASVLTFYRSVFGKDNVDWFRRISSVELLRDQGMYISALAGARCQMVRRVLARCRDDLGAEEEGEEAAGSEGYDDIESSDDSDDSGDESNTKYCQGSGDDEASTKNSEADGDATENGGHAARSKESHCRRARPDGIEDSELSIMLASQLSLMPAAKARK